MDADKVAFLFGEVPEGYDPDDELDREVLVAEQLGLDDPDELEYLDHLDDEDDRQARLTASIMTVVANQIALGEPPEVWEAAQRMTAAGVDRRRALANLTMALSGPLRATVVDRQPFDDETYRANLAMLPMPSPNELAEALEAELREDPVREIEELFDTVAAIVGPADGERGDRSMLFPAIDEALDDLADDDVVTFLLGNRVVHVPTLLDGIVLTHTVTEAEIAAGSVAPVFDLAPFAAAWPPPDGWIDGIDAGTTVAVRAAGPDLALDVEVLSGEPAVDPSLADAVRATIDELAAEDGMPVSATDLVVALVAADPPGFRAPAAPLSALCDAAGVERRGDHLAASPAAWQRELGTRRLVQLVAQFGAERGVVGGASAVLRAFGRIPPSEPGGALPRPDRSDQRKALTLLVHEPLVAAAAAVALLGGRNDAEAAADAAEVADEMLAAASRPAEVAGARWIAAIAAERQYETLEAEAHLRAAVAAEPSFEAAVDRLAWYLADRGEADEALRLWSRLGPDAGMDVRAGVAQFASDDRRLGRNDPCWCGSGRKFKQCHLGRRQLPALPDRVGWLCAKAVTFAGRHLLVPATAAYELAAIRAGADEIEGDVDAMLAAFDDPLVLDVLLHEEGWFDEFLRCRGPLLPEDELLLAQSWQLVDRSVHEVVDVEPGRGMTLRDLRTGETLDVRERSLTHQVTEGTLLCTRVVPDGESHQIVGGVFIVPPGRLQTVLEILDEGDGRSLLAFCAAADRPPILHTREGQPLVRSTAILAVADTAGASRALDGRFDRDEDDPSAWLWLYDLDDDEAIVRGWLRLAGDRLTIETMSEERIGQLLAEVRDLLPGAEVVEEHREPVTIENLRHLGAEPDLDLRDGSPELAEAMEEMLDRMERRWCDESIPALGGRTPREAAADPTRREELVRLIASIPEPANRGGVRSGFRPARLRQMLAIADDE